MRAVVNLKKIPIFLVPSIEAFSTATLAILSIVLSIWLTDEISTLGTPPSRESAGIANLSTMGLAVSILAKNWINFGSPAPYFIAALLFSIGGRIESFFNRYRYGQNAKLEAEKQDLKATLRTETQGHADTKSSYFESLAEAMKYILINETTGFNHRCRVTVYRKQHDQDEKSLRQIFRHSPTQIFEQNGRFRIPADEGIVGAAWRNHGVKEFSCNHDPASREFHDEMQKCLKSEGCSHPKGALSMPSKHYYARALQDSENGQRAGIVVYEATDTDILDVSGIDKVLDGGTLDVARLVRLRGILHSQFNPDPEEE